MIKNIEEGAEKTRSVAENIDYEEIGNTARHSTRIEERGAIDYNLSQNPSSCQSQGSEVVSASQNSDLINRILRELDMPSLSEQRWFRTRRPIDGENFLQQICEKVNEKLFSAVNVNIPLPEPFTNNVIRDSSAFQEVMRNIQGQYELSGSILQRIEYLAMLPQHWKYAEVLKHFKLTRYMWNLLNKFREMDGEL